MAPSSQDVLVSATRSTTTSRSWRFGRSRSCARFLIRIVWRPSKRQFGTSWSCR